MDFNEFIAKLTDLRDRRILHLIVEYLNSLKEKQTSNSGIYGAQNIGFNLCKDNEWMLYWGSDDYAFNKKV